MAESVLVNRKKFISSLDNKLVEPLNPLSKKTRVPKSRLLDEAIEDLLKKYEKKEKLIFLKFQNALQKESLLNNLSIRSMRNIKLNIEK